MNDVKRMVREWAVLACAALFLFTGLAEAQSKFACRRWLELDERAKLLVMASVIDMAHRDRIEIKLPPEYYVRELDSLIQVYIDTDNQQALDSSLGVSIHTIAAMEGDRDNGEPRLEHAKRWMGEWFEFFRAHYPEKYRRLAEDRR
jgi:hypothetical protein